SSVPQPLQRLRIVRQCYTEITIEARFGFNEWLLGEDSPKWGSFSGPDGPQIRWYGSNLGRYASLQRLLSCFGAIRHRRRAGPGDSACVARNRSAGPQT